MKKYGSVPGIVAMLCILVFMPASLTSQQRGGPGGGPPGGGGPGSASAIAEARISENAHAITVGGRLEPQTRIVHRIPSGGFVQAIFVQEGQRVSAGDELLRIRRKDDVMELYQPVPLNARIDGRVSEILVQVEGEVSTGDAAIVLLGTSGYILEANISDKDAFRIDIGQAVKGHTADGAEITGVLQNRSQEPDYATGLFQLTFRFPDNPRVGIGEFILIDLPIDQVRGVFIPRDAVVRRYGSFSVWAVSAEQTLTAREVSLGDVFGDEVLIVTGLEPGENFLRQLTGREREGAPAVGGN